MSASAQRNQPLPPKEETLFRQLVRLHESKQYKKGVKTADLILKKVPEHGETLAMKGLILSSLDRKEEAYELVRRALKADIKSYVCWHVYGILYKGDRVYDQAAKCYLNALRWDKDNLQIYRDLGHLQMQLRDIKGLVETAGRILAIKSNLRVNWVLLAVAHHLHRNYAVAIQVLDAYLETVDMRGSLDAIDRYEIGEVQLYKATIMREAGNLEGAMTLLELSQETIQDRLALMEMQASIHLTLGNEAAAEQIYRKLIARNPDNYEYHHGLCSALRIRLDGDAGGDMAAAAEVYAELREKYPHSAACRRIPLDFLSGAPFQEAVRGHVERFVRRGIPSLFSDLRPLLQDGDKADAIAAACASLQAELPQDDEAQVWLLVYLAQHAVHRGDAAAGVVHIEAALQRQPDLIDAYSARADILAAAGDLPGAAASAGVARQLDANDRYLNSICAKFEFQAGDIEAADATVVPFSREVDSGRSNLFDMQCMWYEIEAGNAWLRRGNLGMALKMFTAVVNQFADITEDQFDFHSYCLRKVTLRSYIDMLRMEDRLYGSPAFVDAATGAIKCYLRLHDDPPGRAEREEEERKVAAMTAEQKKKYVSRKKKEDEKAAKAAAEKLEKDRAAAKARKGNSKFDEDPTGEKLAAVSAPLDEADKLLQKLKESAADRLATHVAAFEVAVRQDKPLRALQAVKHVFSLDGDGPEAHWLLLRLAKLLEGRGETAGHAIVKAVLQSELRALTGGKSPAELNSVFLTARGRASLLHLLTAAKGQLLLSPDAPSAATALLTDSSVLSAAPHTHAACAAVHDWLLNDARDADAAAAFHALARDAYPYSHVFDGRLRLPPPDAALVAKLKALHVTSPDAAQSYAKAQEKNGSNDHAPAAAKN